MAPSVVWMYFQKIKNDSMVKCQVIGCGAELKFNRSTTSLATHLRTVHKIGLQLQPAAAARAKRPRLENNDEEEAEDQPAPVRNQDRAGNNDGAPAPAQRPAPITTRPTTTGSKNSFSGPMDKCINNYSSFSAGGPRDVACMDALLFMISVDNMPLSVTERKGFRRFCKTLQPLYHLPSEPTVTKRLELKYEVMQEIVRRKLESVESVCLTADIWTHKSTMKSYLGVTIHYREGNDLVGIEICCKPLNDRKNIRNLRTAFRDVCREWGIAYDKVSAVITDGGANIKGAVREEFGVLKHITCIAHLINGIGQAAIGLHKYEVPSMAEVPVEDIPENEEDIDDYPEPAADDGTPDDGLCLKTLIYKVKAIVRFFRQSEVANAELLKLQAEEGKPDHQCLRLIQEVRTRWNSCYEMLERFFDLSEFVNRVLLKLQRDRSSRAKAPDFPTGDELEALTEAKELLRPLFQMTSEVSKEKSVTLSKCIPLVATLKRKVDGFVPVTPIGFNLKTTLQTEIDSKFSGIELLKPNAAATILDPRFKKEGFPTAARNAITATANAVNYVGQLVAAEIDRSAAALHDTLTAEEQARAREAPPAEDDGFWSEFDSTVRSRAPEAGPDMAGGLPVEFKHYLSSPPISRKDNPNPLCAWQAMKAEYPHVYTVAMQFLTVMATSVPAERLFSHAGLIVTQLRNRLSGKHIDMLVFLRSAPEWMWFGK